MNATRKVAALLLSVLLLITSLPVVAVAADPVTITVNFECEDQSVSLPSSIIIQGWNTALAWNSQSPVQKRSQPIVPIAGFEPYITKIESANGYAGNVNLSPDKKTIYFRVNLTSNMTITVTYLPENSRVTNAKIGGLDANKIGAAYGTIAAKNNPEGAPAVYTPLYVLGSSAPLPDTWLESWTNGSLNSDGMIQVIGETGGRANAKNAAGTGFITYKYGELNSAHGYMGNLYVPLYNGTKVKVLEQNIPVAIPFSGLDDSLKIKDGFAAFALVEVEGEKYTDTTLTNTEPYTYVGYVWQKYIQLETNFYVVHSSDKTQEPEAIELPTSGKFNITNKVKGGYLYGGLAKDENFNAPLTDGEGNVVNGLELKPEAGKTYYLREVNAEYLKPAVISVRRTPGDTTVDHFLLTALDQDGVSKGFYTWYGFAEYDDTKTEKLTGIISNSGTVQSSASGELGNSETCCLYKQINLYNWGKFEATWYPDTVFRPIPEFTGAGNPASAPEPVVKDVDYFGCTSVEVAGTSLTFVPFYVTADGVLVTGTTVRTVDWSKQATQTWTESTDTTITSITVAAPDSLIRVSGALTFANAMATLPASEESLITAQMLLAKPANMRQATSMFAARRFVTVRGVAPASCTITTLPCRLSVLVYLR